jgi:hypothetical protein
MTSNEHMVYNYFTSKGGKHCIIPWYERKYSVTTSGKVIKRAAPGAAYFLITFKLT